MATKSQDDHAGSLSPTKQGAGEVISLRRRRYDDIPVSPLTVPLGEFSGDSPSGEPIRPGLLPTEANPVVIRALGETGFGLFLYLEEALDIQTLRRLADSNERARIIGRAFGAKR